MVDKPFCQNLLPYFSSEPGLWRVVCLRNTSQLVNVCVHGCLAIVSGIRTHCHRKNVACGARPLANQIDNCVCDCYPVASMTATARPRQSCQRRISGSLWPGDGRLQNVILMSFPSRQLLGTSSQSPTRPARRTNLLSISKLRTWEANGATA